jgi:hypothetical protein
MGEFAASSITAPRSMARSWSMHKTPTDFASYKGYQVQVEQVLISSVRTKEPVPIALGPLEKADVTVADVKAAFAQQVLVTPRKAMILRWLGAELDDAQTLRELRVPDRALFEVAFRQRKPPELEPFKMVRRIVVTDLEGNPCDVPASSSTLISEVKALCKQPPTCQLFFSAYSTSAFGVPLEDERTLGSYSVLDGDVLFCSPGTGAAPAAEAPPPKKK